jgi:hypothetical protein
MRSFENLVTENIRVYYLHTQTETGEGTGTAMWGRRLLYCDMQTHCQVTAV